MARGSSEMPTPKALAMLSSRNIVVRRADSAGGEHISVAVTQRIDRRDDLAFDIGHDAHLTELYPDGREIIGDEADVFILGATRQDFVADNENSRCNNL